MDYHLHCTAPEKAILRKLCAKSVVPRLRLSELD